MIFLSLLQQFFSFFCYVMLDDAVTPIHLPLSSIMLLRGFKVLCLNGFDSVVCGTINTRCFRVHFEKVLFNFFSVEALSPVLMQS